jgi:hypothetical protein
MVIWAQTRKGQERRIPGVQGDRTIPPRPGSRGQRAKPSAPLYRRRGEPPPACGPSQHVMRHLPCAGDARRLDDRSPFVGIRNPSASPPPTAAVPTTKRRRSIFGMEFMAASLTRSQRRELPRAPAGPPCTSARCREMQHEHAERGAADGEQQAQARPFAQLRIVVRTGARDICAVLVLLDRPDADGPAQDHLARSHEILPKAIRARSLRSNPRCSAPPPSARYHIIEPTGAILRIHPVRPSGRRAPARSEAAVCSHPASDVHMARPYRSRPRLAASIAGLRPERRSASTWPAPQHMVQPRVPWPVLSQRLA